MSGFTDEDLRRAKAELAAARRMEWPFPDAEALLLRLEAAEDVVDRIMEGECGIDITNAIRVWESSKGGAGK